VITLSGSGIEAVNSTLPTDSSALYFNVFTAGKD